MKVGLSRRWKFLTVTSLFAVIFILFGQNFDLVPESTLLSDQAHSKDKQISFDLQEPNNLSKRTFWEKYIFKDPHDIIPNDQKPSFSESFDRVIRSGINNYINEKDFVNSELARLLRGLEKKLQTRYLIWKQRLDREPSSQLDPSLLSSDEPGPELSLVANKNYAALKLHSSEMDASCGYSIENQTVDLLFNPVESSQSYSMGYDTKAQASTVKIQMNW